MDDVELVNLHPVYWHFYTASGIAAVLKDLVSRSVVAHSQDIQPA